MKNKGLIIGVLLIIGLFILSPVSASKVIGHGSFTYYSQGEHDIHSWQAIEYNKYHVKVQIKTLYCYDYYPEDNEAAITTFDIKKKNSHSIKLKIHRYDSAGIDKYYTYTKNVKKGNALKYYKSHIKSWLRSYYYNLL